MRDAIDQYYADKTKYPASLADLVTDGYLREIPEDPMTHLTEGDVLVQQGTPHAWVNRGKSICRIAFVLVDANLNNGEINVNT